MGYPRKIVTCCYCGSRAALVLKGAVQHELACASCGAPLHDLKKMPKTRSSGSEVLAEKAMRALESRVKSHGSLSGKKFKKKKKKKSVMRGLLGEAFDVFEDIFD